MFNPHINDLNEAINNARLGYAQSAIESCQRIIDTSGVATRTQAGQSINSLRLHGDLGVIDSYGTAIALVLLAKTLLSQTEGIDTVAGA
jgi:translation initiation factor 2 gamma subunit (eIF-2gamma)